MKEKYSCGGERSLPLRSKICLAISKLGSTSMCRTEWGVRRETLPTTGVALLDGEGQPG